MPSLPPPGSACPLFPFVDPRIALAAHNRANARPPGLYVSMYSDSHEFIALFALLSWYDTYAGCLAQSTASHGRQFAQAFINHRHFSRMTLRDYASPSLALIVPVAYTLAALAALDTISIFLLTRNLLARFKGSTFPAILAIAVTEPATLWSAGIPSPP